MRKKSLQKVSTLERKLWQLCRQLAFKMYKTDCYTCPQKNLEGANCQLGHMWAKGSLHAHLKYDMRVLRWQCYKCNIHHGGMGADFYKRMLAEIGVDKMKKLEAERNILSKAYDVYSALIIKYEDDLRRM